MKKLLAGLLIFAASLLNIGQVTGEESLPLPAEAAQVGLLQGDYGSCSAVVISYDTIVTARHCDEVSFVFVYKNHTYRVIDTNADHVTNTDTMVLKVDGYLEGPYAKVYTGEVKEGTPILTIGYAWGTDKIAREGKAIDYRVLERDVFDVFDSFGMVPDGVTFEGASQADQICGPDPYCKGPSLVHNSTIIPGMSGGGTYAKIDGEWRLVAVNSWLLRDPFMGYPIEYGSAPINHIKF